MSELSEKLRVAADPPEDRTAIAVVRADRVEGGVCLVACGEIDAASAPVLAAELHQAIAAGDVRSSSTSGR